MFVCYISVYMQATINHIYFFENFRLLYEYYYDNNNKYVAIKRRIRRN
jgi:hypothetical protein